MWLWLSSHTQVAACPQVLRSLLTLELSLNLGGPWPSPPRYVVVPDVNRRAVDAAYGEVTAPGRG